MKGLDKICGSQEGQFGHFQRYFWLSSKGLCGHLDAGQPAALPNKPHYTWLDLGMSHLTHGPLGGSVVENPPANAGDVSSIPGLERPLGGGIGNLLQHSCLESSMNKRNRATIHGVAESWTQLSDWAWRRKQNRLYFENRTPSWAGSWTLSYMPRISAGKPGPRKEEPQGSPSPKRIP